MQFLQVSLRNYQFPCPKELRIRRRDLKLNFFFLLSSRNILNFVRSHRLIVTITLSRRVQKETYRWKRATITGIDVAHKGEPPCTPLLIVWGGRARWDLQFLPVRSSNCHSTSGPEEDGAVRRRNSSTGNRLIVNRGNYVCMSDQEQNTDANEYYFNIPSLDELEMEPRGCMKIPVKIQRNGNENVSFSVFLFPFFELD